MLTNESGDNVSHRLIKSNRKNNKPLELELKIKRKNTQIKSINNIDENAFSSSEIEHESDMSGNEPKVVQEKN
jgi:hypothetical protein